MFASPKASNLDGCLALVTGEATRNVPPRLIFLAAKAFVGNAKPAIWLAETADIPSKVANLKNSRRVSLSLFKSSFSSKLPGEFSGSFSPPFNCLVGINIALYPNIVSVP